MRKQGLWVSLGLVFLVLTLLAACAQTPTTSTPSPTSKPTAVPTQTVAPVATPKPTATTPSATPKASAPATSFAGKTVTIVVPYSAGGGTDITARLYARFLSKYLQGNPNVVVRSMPGGDGTIGANYVHNAKPDGLTALMASGGTMYYDLMKAAAAKYDLTTMSPVIGAGIGDVWYLKSGIISKPEDIVKAKGIVFGSAAGLSGWLFIIVKELMNIPTEKIVVGYTGTGDVHRALISGEVNMTGRSTPGYWDQIAPLVEKGEFMLVFQGGLVDQKRNVTRSPAAPPVPTGKELYETVYGKPPSGMAWEAYLGLQGSSMYDKILMLSPGVSEGIIRAYWEAADKMLKDPEFRKMGDALIGTGSEWTAGDALDKGFKVVYKMEPQVVTWLKDTLKKYGTVVE